MQTIRKQAFSLNASLNPIHIIAPKNSKLATDVLPL